MRRYFVKTERFTTALLVSAILALILLGTELFAQNLTNETSGNINNAGTIRFRQDNAQFINNRPNPVSGGFIVNTGTIEFRGLVANPVFVGSNPVGVSGQRIGGTVEYSAAAGNITVTGTGAATYYTNLVLSGGSLKSVPDAVYVYGNYNPSTSGNRTYAGTFYYDRAENDDQLIYPENGATAGTNAYNNLTFLGNGTKTIAYVAGPGGEVYVDNDFTVSDAAVQTRVYDDMVVGRSGGSGSTVAGPMIVGDGTNNGSFSMRNANITYSSTVDVATGVFNIEGTGNGVFNGVVTINTGSMNLTSTVANTGNATYNANVNINNNGTLLVAGEGDATFEQTVAVAAGGTLQSNNNVAGIIDVNGTLTLANAANATLSLGNNTYMYISGVFNNNFDARTNMTFGNGSLVTYDGQNNQQIMTTVAGNNNDYAGLVIRGAAGTRTPVNNATSPNINIRESFELGTDGDIRLDLYASNPNAYVNITGNGPATYLGLSEVYGKFRRTSFTAANGLVFNNAETVLDFATAPASFFQLDIRGGLVPDYTKIATPNAVTTDVQRRITVETNAAPNQGTVSRMRIAYLPNEYNPSGPDREDRLRLLEAYGNASVRGDKITTGVPITVRNYDNTGWEYLEISGVNNPPSQHLIVMTDNYGTPGQIWEVSRQSDIVLTDEVGLMISIRHGRWSDPETWDEGRKPISEDNCIIRHVVYTGYDGGASQVFGARPWPDNEEATPGLIQSNGGYVLANSVLIEPENMPITADDRALLIGNQDNAPGVVLVIGTQSGLGNGIRNDNTEALSGWTPNWTNTTGLQGIYVLPPNTYTPVIRFSQITNSGSITNSTGSTIEIGD